MTPAQFVGEYRRLAKHGVREPAPYPELEKACLIWPWSKDKVDGRAHACVDRKGDNAARHLWRLFRGPIPEGMCICHHCDNRSCVELTHLFMSTVAGNNADKKRKGRQAGAPGEANGSARLTWAKVGEIRERYVGGGVTHRELATEYGVSLILIGNIIRRKNWIPDLPQETPQEAHDEQETEQLVLQGRPIRFRVNGTYDLRYA